MYWPRAGNKRASASAIRSRPAVAEASIASKPSQDYQATWVSAVLVAIYIFHSFSPVGVLRFQLRWYHVLVFCVIIFATNRARFSLKAAAPFLVVVGLAAFGALIAPLRVGFSGELLQNTLGTLVSLFGYFLVLPTLASARCRRLVLAALLLSALFWLSALRSFVAEMGDGARLQLTGAGQDRNFIAFILGIGIVILLGAGLFWPKRGTFRWHGTGIRIVAIAGSVWLLCAIPLTFSRSGIVVALSMILVALLVYSLKNRIRGVPLAVLLIAIVVGIGSILIPKILVQLPSWEIHLDRLVNWRTDDAMSARRSFILKGLMIVRENPLIGVGVGMSKAYLVAGGGPARRRGLIHNGYLTTWAELGLLGFASTGTLLGIWLIELRRRIRDPRDWTTDLICLLVGGSTLAMNFFLDYSSVYWIVAMIICGMAYERRLHSQDFRPLLGSQIARGRILAIQNRMLPSLRCAGRSR